jgi:hypothetical protein
LESKEKNRTLKATYESQQKELEDAKRFNSSKNTEIHECKWCREKYFKSEKYLNEHYLRRHKDLIGLSPIEKHIIYQTIPEEKKQTPQAPQITQKKYVEPLVMSPEIKEVVKYKNNHNNIQRLDALEEKLGSFLEKATTVLTKREASIKQLRDEEQSSRRTVIEKKDVPKSEACIEKSAEPSEAPEIEKAVENTEKENTSIVKKPGPRRIDKNYSPERSNVFFGKEGLSSYSL